MSQPFVKIEDKKLQLKAKLDFAKLGDVETEELRNVVGESEVLLAVLVLEEQALDELDLDALAEDGIIQGKPPRQVVKGPRGEGGLDLEVRNLLNQRLSGQALRLEI